MKLRSVRYLIREGFKNIIKNSLMSLASIAVFTSCLLIIGSAMLMFANISHAVDNMMEQNVVIVFIEPGTSVTESRSIKNSLLQIENIESCEFVSSEDGFEDLVAKLSENDSNLIKDHIGKEFLPDSYRVILKDLSLQKETVSEIKNIENIRSIRESDDLASRLLSLRDSISYVSIGVIAILFIVTVFIIANTVKITMFSRRLEISIMKAVGATKNFIRLPFLIEGVMLGVFSALLSLGLVYMLYTFAADRFASLLLSINSSFLMFNDLLIPLAVSFLSIGVLTGSFGSFISMGKYLKEHGSVVYDENLSL